jgi:hypothetical protein
MTVTIAPSNVGGSGLFFKEWEQPLLSLKMEQVLSKEAIQKFCLQEETDDRLCLLVFLLWIKQQSGLSGQLKEWQDYVFSLPKEAPQPYAWAESMEETPLSPIILSKLKQLEGEFEHYSTKYEDLNIEWSDWLWAEGMIKSRTLHLSSKNPSAPLIALVPIIDQCNHSVTPNAYWTIENNCVCLYATKELSPNQEIFISYGEKTNEELLFTYGFALAHNPYDALSLFVPLAEQFSENDSDEDAIPLKKQWIKTWGLSPRLQLRPQKYLPIEQWMDSNAYLCCIMGALMKHDGLSFDPLALNDIPLESPQILMDLLSQPQGLKQVLDARIKLMLSIVFDEPLLHHSHPSVDLYLHQRHALIQELF